MPQDNEHTTRFKVDISNLKAGIKEANRQIRLANAEFKAASAGMDDWGKSVDGVKAKITQLETVLQAENTKLQSLKDQLALTEQEYGANSTAATELRIAIANQQATVTRTERTLSGFRTTLSELEDAQNDSADAAEEQSNAYKDLKDTISRQESELGSLRQEYANLVLSQGESSDEARQLASRISDLNDDLQSNRQSLRNAEDAANDLTGTMGDMDDAADDSSDGFTIMKGALADLVAEGISKAVEALKDLVTQSSEASASLQAQTGATAKEMEGLNESIKNVYGNNFGESMQDVADAMADVKRQSGDISTDQLEKLTESAMTLRDTFGYEVGESMRAVNMLMDQFGISSDQAFNMIVKGAQNGLDKNDDLLDSINEYSVHYSQLGYTADDFYNSLKNGTEAGTFSVDKLGDSMKEFGIRVKDNSDSTRTAFDDLGYDADKLTEMFAQGGDSAHEATSIILDDLFDLKDKVKQNEIGVALFGTMWEDLGVEGVKALMDVNGEAVTTTDAMNDLGQVKYGDLSSQLGSIGRLFSTEILQPIVDAIMPAVQDFAQFVIDNFDVMGPIITGVATAFTILAAALGIQALINGVQKAFAVLNVTMLANPIVLIVAAIAGLVVAFVTLWNKSEAFREFWQGLWDGIKSVVGTVVDAIGGFFSSVWDTIKGVWNAAPKFFSGIWDGIKKAFSNVGSWFSDKFTKAKNGVQSAWSTTKGFFKDSWESTKNAYATADSWFKDKFSKAKSGVESAWSGTKSFFKKSWESTKSAYATADTWLGNKFGDAWSAIKNKFSSWGDFWSGLWTKIKDKFSDIGSSLGSTISDTIKGGLNKVLGLIEGTINKGIGLINSAIGLANKLPGVNVGNVPTISLPRLKQGGVLAKGQIGLLEGDGAEAVVPLENNKKWISKTAKDLKASLQAEGLLTSQATNQNVTNNYNFTQNNTSPKALSRLDIYRQTRNQLKFARGV